MRNILKQSAWLFWAQISARILGFFYTIFLAQNLGVSDFGLFAVGLAYFAIFSTFAEFGFNRLLVREIALDITKAGSLALNIGVIRVILAFIFYLIFVFLIFLADPDKLRVMVIALTALTVFPATLAQTFDSIFIAKQKLQYSAVSVILSQLVTVTGGVFLVNQGKGIPGAIFALILGQLFYGVLLLLFLKKEKIHFFSKVEFFKLKKIFISAFPFALLGILGLLYFRIDTIILSYLKGNFDTGIYSAAYRFLEASAMLPGALSIALFPVLTKLHQIDIGKLRRIYHQSLFIMGILGILIMGIIFVFIPPIIQTFLPGYQNSIAVVQILVLTIPFLFMISPQGAILLSKESLLKPLIYISIFNLAFNILLNFLLIPKYTYLGSAWATVISDIVGFLIFLIYIELLLKNEVSK